MKSKIKPMYLHPVKNRTIFKSKLMDFWYGNPPKLVGKKPETGYLSSSILKGKITSRINQIIKVSDSIKIGVMGDTSVRMDAEDYRDKYDYVSRDRKSVV